MIELNKIPRPLLYAVDIAHCLVALYKLSTCLITLLNKHTLTRLFLYLFFFLIIKINKLTAEYSKSPLTPFPLQNVILMLDLIKASKLKLLSRFDFFVYQQIQKSKADKYFV